VKSAERAEKRVQPEKRARALSSDEDEPAPCPSATVLARRASREVKPMREESSSDEDAEEPEEWEGADETSCSEEEGEEVERRRADAVLLDERLVVESGSKHSGRRAHRLGAGHSSVWCR